MLSQYVYDLFPLQLHNAKVALENHDSFEHGIHVQLTKETWAVAGCPEFFQNLNFVLSQTDAHSPLVTLSAPAVKLERKTLHFASTSIAAVCGRCCVIMIVVVESWSGFNLMMFITQDQTRAPLLCPRRSLEHQNYYRNIHRLKGMCDLTDVCGFMYAVTRRLSALTGYLEYQKQSNHFYQNSLAHISCTCISSYVC